MANSYQKLNFKQRQWAKLYTGRSDISGNATQCYQAIYGPGLTERSAQVGGSRLLANPHVQKIVAAAEQRVIDDLALDAGFVLKESLRLYQRAMGDDSYDHVKVDTDPDTGLERVSVTSQRSYDPTTAHKALQAIGQHRDVQAFSQVIEHNHTHVLEQRLAARSKLIEGRAQVAQLPGDPLSLEGDPAPAAQACIDDEAPSSVVHGGDEEARTVGAGDSKRVHIDGGQGGRGPDQDVSAPEREGATAK